jgi:outer membrane protein assembly factor BamB
MVQRSLAAVAVTALLLAGCTPPPPAKTKAYLVEPQLSPVRVVHQWQTTPPPMETFGTERQEFAGALHIGAKDIIVVGDSKGGVVAYRGANGEVRWRAKVPGVVHAKPAYSEGYVYVPLLDGGVVALDVMTGEEVWAAGTDNSLEGTPLVSEGRLFVVDSGDVLYALDAMTGKELWRHAREFPGYFTIKGATTPVLIDGELLAGFSDGHLVSFVSETGEVVWDTDLSSGETEFADVDVSLIVEDDVVYTASYAGGLYAVDRVDGTVLWQRELKSTAWLHAMPEQLVTASSTGRILAFDRSGKGVWGFRLKENAPSSVTSYGPYVVTATAQGPVYVLDGPTGYPMFKWRGLAGIHAPLTFGAERIYLHTDAGTVLTVKLGW